MLSRRLFIAASCVLATCRVTEAIASLGEALSGVAEEWLGEAVDLALKNLDKITNIVLQVEDKIDVMINVKATILDVRRKVTDSTPEHYLDVQLGQWLSEFHHWVNDKPREGESNVDYEARHDRQRDILENERDILENDWRRIAANSTAMLKDIESLGYELQSIHSDLMSFEEWHTYQGLMSQEKMTIEVIDSKMPTDPIVIKRLDGVAEQLDTMVVLIDKRAALLDAKIAKYTR